MIFNKAAFLYTCETLFDCNLRTNQSVACYVNLLLLLLHGLQVGLEVHRLLDLGAQQSSQHGVSRDLHPLQSGTLHLSFELKDLLGQDFNLRGKKVTF